ncbi:MAG: transposase [Oscillatoriales cyanobacterium SM2_1_8]|nr:transposase [Oscillatoriales cyanobacterium SM2_1_8]
MPARVLIAEGAGADCRQACQLRDGIDATHVLGDRAYDTNEILGYLQGKRMGQLYFLLPFTFDACIVG